MHNPIKNRTAWAILLMPLLPVLLPLAGCAGGGGQQAQQDQQQARFVEPNLPDRTTDRTTDRRARQSEAANPPSQAVSTNRSTPDASAREGRRLGTARTGTAQASEASPAAGVFDAAARDGWHVVLGNFPSTPEGEQAAREALQQVETRGRLRGAYLEPREQRIVLAFGNYAGPSDPAAQRDLQRIRGIEVGGGRPYAAAALGPPSARNLGGSVPEFDLRNARRLHPGAIYTLQIGIYGRPDNSQPRPEELAEFRKSAEEAVNDLRRQGEVAFYFHDRLRSTVTIGAFRQDDYDPTIGAAGMSFQVRETMRRHPQNLLNGQGIRQRIPGTDGSREEHWTMQKSFLVGIPGA